MNVFALDFDGVLCDSVAEAAVTAWRAGGKIWPRWHGEQPPEDCLRHFITLRPLLETGYQAILLMALIEKQLNNEVIESRFLELCDHLLVETGSSREYLAQLFGETRDEWIARDLGDWLGRHRFHDKVIETFATRVGDGRCFILTTKQERFVQILLQGRGIQFPVERIFGLDRGRKKEEILEKLLARTEFQNATWHFVEDRLPTLLRVAARNTLKQVRLYLVDWGYNTAKDRDAARQNPAITLWSPEQFLMV